MFVFPPLVEVMHFCKNTPAVHVLLCAPSQDAGMYIVFICPVPGEVNLDHLGKVVSVRLLL